MNYYKKDVNGQIRIWSITSVGNHIIINHGILNGKTTDVTEIVTEGLAGRDLRAQIESRINSRINKQLDRGYRATVKEAQEYARKNKINTFSPMLAQQFEKRKNVHTAGSVLQRKLDGNRMLVTKQNGKLIAYTRNGKPIETLDHITNQLGWLEEGQTIDGEIYVHGKALKDINSCVRKKQAGTEELNYHIYDMVDDRPFKERFKTIMSSATQEWSSTKPNIVVEPMWEYTTKEHMLELFSTVRQQGYEGLMMRVDDTGYEAGKRSASLLKIKYRHDAEAVVIDIEQAKNDAGILVCSFNDRVFKLVAPGDKAAKLHVAMMPELYVGKRITFSYAYMTDFGIPFHAVAERWR